VSGCGQLCFCICYFEDQTGRPTISFECLLWVKSGKSKGEQIESALHPPAEVIHKVKVSLGPNQEIIPVSVDPTRCAVRSERAWHGPAAPLASEADMDKWAEGEVGYTMINFWRSQAPKKCGVLFYRLDQINSQLNEREVQQLDRFLGGLSAEQRIAICMALSP